MIKLVPFILSLAGVLSDCVTTAIGLDMGFYEMHPSYHPLNALMVFWGAIAALTMLLREDRLKTTIIDGISLMSYLGVINNTLVILGIFSGLNPI